MKKKKGLIIILCEYVIKIELKFDVLINLHDLVKRGWVSHIDSSNLKCIQLCLEMLELIMFNWND